MDSKQAYKQRSYEDFDPIFKWRREQDRDTVELHLPGQYRCVVSGVVLHRSKYYMEFSCIDVDVFIILCILVIIID